MSVPSEKIIRDINAWLNVEITTQVFPSNNSSLQVNSQCNAILFFNGGTATCTVNNVPLLPNQTLSYSGNLGENIITTFNLKFTTAGTQQIYVTKKTYQ